MQHSFDIDIAKEYGMLEAVLLNNIDYWIKHNKANEINYYDGSYWTYNSTKAFNELFPYVSQRQIQNALKHLREEGILKTGNYNKIKYDRTLWYAFTKKGECIMQKCKMEEAESENGDSNNVEPIPDINPVDKTSYVNTEENNNNQQADNVIPFNREEELLKNEFEKLWNLYPRKEGKAKAFKAYCKFRKSRKEDYITSEEVEDGIENYLRYIKANNIDIKYIKQGATYFNNRCWEDVYQEPQETNTPSWFNQENHIQKTTEEEVEEIERTLGYI